MGGFSLGTILSSNPFLRVVRKLKKIGQMKLLLSFLRSCAEDWIQFQTSQEGCESDMNYTCSLSPSESLLGFDSMHLLLCKVFGGT